MQAPPKRPTGRRRAGRPGRVVGPSLAGFLRRKSGPATGWQRGWCVLAGGQLTWFDDKGGVRQFTVQLASCTCKRSKAPMASTGAELEKIKKKEERPRLTTIEGGSMKQRTIDEMIMTTKMKREQTLDIDR